MKQRKEKSEEKKKSFLDALKEDREEDCEPKLGKKKSSGKDEMTKSSKQRNEREEEKKKSFFGVFKDEDPKTAGKKKDQRANNFKFKKDPRENIKNHFTVSEKKKKPIPIKNVKTDFCEDSDSSSDDEEEVIKDPRKKFSFSNQEEQKSPIKRISTEETAGEAAALRFDSPRKTLTKNRRSIVRMVRLSKSYGAEGEVQSPKKSSQSQFRGENSQSQSKSHQENSKSKKKTSKKKKKDKGMAKIDSHFKPISIDDLLKLPETVGDTGLTMDEILDKVDEEIKEQKRKDEANMKILDQTIEKHREKSRALQQRMAENAVLRDKLTKGLTKPALKKLFEQNLPYLEGIREGRIESARHDDFHKSPMSRQALQYKMITDPFSDEQLDWTLEEFKSRWMPTTKEFHQINDYIWKVIVVTFQSLILLCYPSTSRSCSRSVSSSSTWTSSR